MISKKAPNPIDRHVGSRVRMRRMMLGMSQEKLGDALDLTFQQVQKYEKGKNRVSMGMLIPIAKLLGVPIDYFAVDIGAPEIPGTGIMADLLDTRAGLNLARAFLAMPVHQRTAFVALAEAMSTPA